MATLSNEFQKIGTGTQKTYGQSAGYLELWAKCNSQDIINNTSNVTVELRLVVPYGYIGNYQATYWSISGDLSNSGNLGSDNYRSRTLGSATDNIQHTSDGTKEISFSGVFNPTAWGQTIDVSASATLPTIPRNSTITATSAYIEETSQLTITQYASNYTHTIQYSFEGLSGYILANGTTTQTETKIPVMTGTTFGIGFPIPSSWYSQIPSKSSSTCTLTIKTYSGNTQIGNAYTTTFYVSVRQRPTATATVSDTNDTTYNLTGNRNILVKGYSTASVSWTATPTPQATISSVKINGATASSSPYAFTLRDNTISVLVTDSRGLTNSDNITHPTFTLKNYFNPSITIQSIERTSPTNNYATIKFNGTWFNQSFGSQNNTLTLTWKYRETGTSNWTNGGTLTLNTNYKVSNNNFWSGTGSSASEINVGGNLLSYEKNWDVLLIATDKLVSYQAVGTLAKGIPVINWGEDFLNVNGDIKQNEVSIFNRFNYSTNETIVGVWIDGKPIYRNVYSGTGNNGTAVAELSNVNQIIKMTGVIKSNYDQWWPIPNCFYSDANYNTSLDFNVDNKIYLGTGPYYSLNSPYIVIVEYTKTTD